MSGKELINIAIVGGGPCGLAAALHLAQRGCSCTVFESRTRSQIYANFTGIGWAVGGRSYPLALQHRGIQMLNLLHPDAEAKIRAAGEENAGCSMWVGNDPPPPPPPSGHIFCPRDAIITCFIELIERDYPTLVKLRFGARLREMVETDSELGELTYVLRFSEPSDNAGDKPELIEAHARVVLGTDGVNSAVQSYLQRVAGVKVESFQDPTLYKFFLIPKCNLSHGMHVMPRAGLGNMMILPYKDGALSAAFLASPSCTHFGPGVDRDTLVGPASKAPPTVSQVAALRAFFEQHFPAVAAAVPKASAGIEDGFEQLFQRDAFIGRTIRSSAINHERVVLMGDAAHATLPVTGQGVNAALRDTTELLHGPNAFWDGCVESASAAFAKFNAAVVQDRGALFEASKWISSNRWNWKYRFLLMTIRTHMKLHRKYPWLLGPHFLQALASNSYLEAWQSFHWQALFCKITFFGMLAASGLTSWLAFRVLRHRAAVIG